MTAIVQKDMKKIKRVQMDLSQDSFSRLQKIKALADASSYTDVVKDSMRLYEYILENELDGAEFFMKDKNGKTVVLKIFS